MQPKSPRGVQQHEVNAAADALLADGERPTVERVRMKIGRGSPNTVGPMLESWFSTLASRLGVRQAGPGEVTSVPPELRQAVEAMWTQATELADQRADTALKRALDQIDAERQMMAGERADMAARITASAEREALLREALDQSQAHVGAMTQQLDQVQGRLTQCESELARARDALAALVQEKDAAAREHREHMTASARERDQLQERFDTTVQRHLLEVDRGREEIKRLVKALATSEQRSAARLAHLEAEVREAVSRARSLEEEKAALLGRLNEQATRYGSLRDESSTPVGGVRRLLGPKKIGQSVRRHKSS